MGIKLSLPLLCETLIPALRAEGVEHPDHGPAVSLGQAAR